jgi:hypothetical protein
MLFVHRPSPITFRCRPSLANVNPALVAVYTRKHALRFNIISMYIIIITLIIVTHLSDRQSVCDNRNEICFSYIDERAPTTDRMLLL